MLTKKMKKKQSYGDLQRRKREILNGNNNNNKKRNILVAGDSMFSGISGKGLSKKLNVSVTSFSGGTSEKNNRKST